MTAICDREFAHGSAAGLLSRIEIPLSLGVLVSPLPLEFVAEGMPVSLQGSARNRRRFLEALESEAYSVWRDESLVENFVAVEITFCVDSTFHNIPDIDNILKPILDTLESLVYDNDNRVSDIICRKRFLGFELAIREPSPMLMQVFGQAGNRPFVHIRVTEAPI